MAWSSGAGSLVSNVDDLAAWDRAITEGKLLTKENWARMFVPPKIEWNLSTYAFGFIASIRYGYPTIWHNGLIEGFQTVAMRFPEQRVYAAVLMNMVGATTSSGLVLERLVEAYFAK